MYINGNISHCEYVKRNTYPIMVKWHENLVRMYINGNISHCEYVKRNTYFIESLYSTLETNMHFSLRKLNLIKEKQNIHD